MYHMYHMYHMYNTRVIVNELISFELCLRMLFLACLTVF